jgi:hypothetical protein
LGSALIVRKILSRGAEQDSVDDLLVLTGDFGDLFLQRKDLLEIACGQQFAAAVFEPLGAGQRLALRAVAIAAGVVPDVLVAAGVALLDMATKHRGLALHNRGHDRALRGRQAMAGVSSRPLGRRKVEWAGGGANLLAVISRYLPVVAKPDARSIIE